MGLNHIFIDLSVGFGGLSIQICGRSLMSSEHERDTAVTSLLRDASSSVTSSAAATRSIRRVSSQRETAGATDGSQTDRRTDGEMQSRTKEHMER